MARIFYNEEETAPFSAELPYSPITLFGASDSGYYFDFSNINSLSQDDAGTVPVTASGQTVGRVLDLSGRGNHLYQPDAASRPTYIESAGKKFLRFTTNDSLLSAPGLTFDTTDIHFIMSARQNAELAAAGLFAEAQVGYADNNSPNGWVFQTSSSSQYVRLAGYANVVARSLSASGLMPASTLEFVKTGTAGEALRNGVRFGTAITTGIPSIASNTDTRLVCGARLLADGNVNLQVSGDIGGVFRISRVLSAGDATDLRAYLMGLLA